VVSACSSPCRNGRGGGEWARLPSWKKCLGLLLIIEPGGLATRVCWAAIWVRMVIISGLYGLYQSVWVRLDGFGIFAALLSFVLGYFFSKHQPALLRHPDADQCVRLCPWNVSLARGRPP
jgi:hypothetical protein